MVWENLEVKVELANQESVESIHTVDKFPGNPFGPDLIHGIFFK